MPLKLAGMPSVQLISDNGVAQVLQMHANLMGSAGEQTTQNERVVSNFLQHFETRTGASPFFDNGHFLSMHRMPADRRDYLTLFY